MKLLNFVHERQTRLGIRFGDRIIDARKTAQKHGLDIPLTSDEVIKTGGVGSLLPLFDDPVFIPEEHITYAPAVLSPRKILCVGLNYRNHAAETDMEIPEYPVLFSKSDNALAAHAQDILLPECAFKFDYEAELVIVIGETAKNIKRGDARRCIFGYTIGNDLSARDLQFRSSQWFIGKNCDGFAPIGPHIITADEIDVSGLGISSSVNGETRQNASTADMIFDCESIVSYASSIMTLYPGDLILTGTPGGVIMGYPPEKQVWLKRGDRVEITIEGIGTLSNLLV